ncbi:unnamed protein product, partial [Rotaria sp. Silwood2]
MERSSDWNTLKRNCSAFFQELHMQTRS